MVLRRCGVAIVFAWLLAACTAPREPDAAVVDVVVSAPLASDSAVSAAPLATVQVAANPEPSAGAFAIDDNPRRVLVPPPLTPATSSSLPPQTAVPLLPANVAMLSPVFAALASSHASSATPDGQPIAGTFKQDDRLHLPVTLQAGRCYTIVAVSSGVTELDIALMVLPAPGMPLPAITLAMDSTTGPTAVVGGGANCFKNPMPVPMPAVAVIRATAGAGTVLAQAFSR